MRASIYTWLVRFTRLAWLTGVARLTGVAWLTGVARLTRLAGLSGWPFGPFDTSGGDNQGGE